MDQPDSDAPSPTPGQPPLQEAAHPPLERPAAPLLLSSGPTRGGERIAGIDVLRGFAVLGIFVMNLPTFAYSRYAFMDPSLQGGLDAAADRWAWIGSHVVFEMKMMTLFSLLFGAGLFIIADRQRRRRKAWDGMGRRPARPAAVIYRRLGVLLLVGLVHAYLVWEGDILFTYAVLGALVFPLYRLPAGWLVALACLLLPVAMASNFGFGWFFEASRDAWDLQQADPERFAALPGWQQEFADEWPDLSRDFAPTEEMLAEERRVFQGGFLDLMPSRAEQAFFIQVPMMLMFSLWRVGGLMLLGMALFKSGGLRGAWSVRTYAALAVLGLGLGYPMAFWGARGMLASDFDVVHLFKVGWNTNYVASLLVAMGYFGLVFLICKINIFSMLRLVLASIGRLALTNYLMQSVIAATLFYGYGFGLWNEIGRAGLLGVVAGVWIGQAAFSTLWLRVFDFGPLEWLWRRTTYPSAT
ncbi:MAG: DUF418 domain-containing protein [Planctomycetota bacterium]